MTQHRSTVEREDAARGGREVGFEGADCVHASMEPAKPATLDPGLDGVGADTGIEQLARRYRAMLPPRERYDRLIDPRRGYVDFGTVPSTD